jgi:hypothetical protein
MPCVSNLNQKPKGCGLFFHIARASFALSCSSCYCTPAPWIVTELVLPRCEPQGDAVMLSMMTPSSAAAAATSESM